MEHGAGSFEQETRQRAKSKARRVKSREQRAWASRGEFGFRIVDFEFWAAGFAADSMEPDRTVRSINSINAATL
jgi:hypothetical protein